MVERPKNRSWHRVLNEAWLDRLTRARFEKETGAVPMATSQAALGSQLASGQYAEYEREFRIWATVKFGLLDAAPQSVKNEVASRTRHASHMYFQ